MSIKATLIISTYNWPEALLLVLKSVLKQSVPPHEIIIADDGSSKDTKELINTFKKRTPERAPSPVSSQALASRRKSATAGPNDK